MSRDYPVNSEFRIAITHALNVIRYTLTDADPKVALRAVAELTKLLNVCARHGMILESPLPGATTMPPNILAASLVESVPGPPPAPPAAEVAESVEPKPPPAPNHPVAPTGKIGSSLTARPVDTGPIAITRPPPQAIPCPAESSRLHSPSS